MRTWLSRIVCLLILLVPVGGIAQSKHRTKKPKKSVTQLRRDLTKIRTRKAELKHQLRVTKRAAKAVLSDIHKVDGELTDLQGKVEDTGQRLDDSKTQQKRVAVELDAATRKLAQTKEQVRRRIKRMYMQGDSNLLTVIAGVGDTGEIASRQFVMQRIAAQDKKVFLDYRTAQEQVKAKKSEADNLVHRIAGLLDTQRQQQGSLKDARHRKGQYLVELKAKQGELQEMLQQFDDDERTITAEIQSFYRRTSRPGKKGGSQPPYRGGALSFPVSGRITSNFGMRFHPILHINRMHSGIDIGAPIGAKIHAAADGVVIHSSYMRGYGNVVIIDHGSGLSTVYAHCSRIIVSDGQRVRRGQYVANVGSTGLSTGPHLHFEVRLNGHPVNPRNYL